MDGFSLLLKTKMAKTNTDNNNKQVSTNTKHLYKHMKTHTYIHICRGKKIKQI